jgi:hypothetical protein
MASANARAFLLFLRLEPGEEPSGEVTLPEARRAVMRARATFERKVGTFTRRGSDTRMPGRPRVIQGGVGADYFERRLDDFEACFAARTNTVCTGVNGCTVECLVNDPSQCPGPSNGSCQSSSGDTGPMACANTCKPDEYAVECEASGLGGQGPFAVPPSGSGCHADTTAPQSAEAAYYCCACGT